MFVIEKKKMGRPTDNPRGERLGFRISEEEGRMLEYCMRNSDMSKSDILRLGIRKVYEGMKKDKK